MHRGLAPLNNYKNKSIDLFFPPYEFMLVSYNKLRGSYTKTNKLMFGKITFIKINIVLMLRVEKRIPLLIPKRVSTKIYPEKRS